MAAACSPPWRRGGSSREEHLTSSPSGSKLGPTDVTPERPLSRNTASPEDSCAICLGAPENKSFTDSCFHTFCFACLAEWAKVKAECPLCKQRFKSIIHSVRSLEDYDQYFVSELQRPSATIEINGQRFRFPTTMTIERRQEMEALRRAQESRTHQPSIAAHRNQNRYLPRGAVTSAERLELYTSGLWAVPYLSQYRIASPEFYRDNPACTHRLVPWLNRELNALMAERRSHIMYAMDYVISLTMEFDIRHPEFSRRMEALLHENTEHFVHEFYLYATSVHDMAAYDQNTVYMPQRQAFDHGNPVGMFRQALQLQAPLSYIAFFEGDSPQPGPSGLAVAQEEVIATAVNTDSDSDSSDCIVVQVIKPQRERTPVVIDLLTSDEDDESLIQRERLECLPGDGGPSHSDRSPNHRLPQRHAAVDSRPCSQELSRCACDRQRRTSVRENSLRPDMGQRRRSQRIASATCSLERSSSSDEDSTQRSWVTKRKNLMRGENRECLPQMDAGPSRSNLSTDRRLRPRHAALSYDERSQRKHSHRNSPEHSRSTRDRRHPTCDRGSSSQSDYRRQQEARRVASSAYALQSLSSSSQADGTHSSAARRPRKLASVVGAVKIASKSPSCERHRTHHHHHHHRRSHHHREQKCKKYEMIKREHKRRNPSEEF